MNAPGFVLQSLLVGDGRVEVSYYDEQERGPHGITIHTAVITLDGSLDAEMAEVVDAALQLVTAWAGLQREHRARPGP